VAPRPWRAQRNLSSAPRIGWLKPRIASRKPRIEPSCSVLGHGFHGLSGSARESSDANHEFRGSARGLGVSGQPMWSAIPPASRRELSLRRRSAEEPSRRDKGGQPRISILGRSFPLAQRSWLGGRTVRVDLRCRRGAVTAPCIDLLLLRGAVTAPRVDLWFLCGAATAPHKDSKHLRVELWFLHGAVAAPRKGQRFLRAGLELTRVQSRFPRVYLRFSLVQPRSTLAKSRSAAVAIRCAPLLASPLLQPSPSQGGGKGLTQPPAETPPSAAALPPACGRSSRARCGRGCRRRPSGARGSGAARGRWAGAGRGA